MIKQQLLELEANAHMSIRDLESENRALARTLSRRLEERAVEMVRAQVQGGSPKLQNTLRNMRVELGEEARGLKLREATLRALEREVARNEELAGDDQLIKEIENLAESIGRRAGAAAAPADTSLVDALHLDEPLAFHPEFRSEIAAARLYRLSDAVGLGDNTAQTLIDTVGQLEAINEESLGKLIVAGTLSVEQARAAGQAVSLYQVLDQRPEMVSAVRKAGLQEPRELVMLDRPAWKKLIEDHGIKPPGGISADVYAGAMLEKVQSIFPSEFLSLQLAQVDTAASLQAADSLAALRKRNPKVPILGQADFDALRLDGLGSAQVKRLRQAYQDSLRFVNRYPGLRLAEVMDDPKLSKKERSDQVDRRVKLANRFFAENPGLLFRDLTPISAELKELKFAPGATQVEQGILLRMARAYQRSLAVTDKIAEAEALVAGGYGSALKMVEAGEAKVARDTGLALSDASRYLLRAKEIASGVAGHFGTVIDVIDDGFSNTAAGNVSPTVYDFLKEIAGFADFFGSQSFCNCRHCQSILSPAAYFVDLMCFVDDHVTQPFFAGKANHPLNLRTRRPDLWELELTCENTNTEIPYLEVINEILENAVARDAGFVGNYADRAAVRTAVYQNTVPARENSFRQPFHLPFEELRAYLRHFERSLADLGETGRASGDDLARLRLELPPRDYALITQPNNNIAFLRGLYQVNFNLAGGGVRPFEVQELLPAMNISRDELDDLIQARFVTNNGAVNIRIQGEKRSAESIQNDIECIKGLTPDTLDRMHRFTRLWRATDWRPGELDLVLTHLEQEGIGAGITPATARAIGQLHRIQQKLELSVEDLTTLWARVPRHATVRPLPSGSEGNGSGSNSYPPRATPQSRLAIPLFNRLFNTSSFSPLDLNNPPNFIHPAMAAVPPVAVDPNLLRLQAATGANEDNLYQIILGLARPLGIDPTSANDAGKTFTLDHANLSLIYRHARLARLLKLSPPELFALISLTRGISNGAVGGLADLEALIRLHGWWKETQWSIAELVQIIRAGLAVATTRAALAGTPGGETVTCTVTNHGQAQPAETVVFAANGDLAAAMADWNNQASQTEAYQSDALGNPDFNGTFLSIRTAVGGVDTKIEMIADSANLFTANLPAVFSGTGIPLPSLTTQTARPADLAQQIVDQVGEEEALIFAGTVFAFVDPINESQSLAILAANRASFEALGTEGRYRLANGYDPNAALNLPAGVNQALEPALRAVLNAYHSEMVILAKLPGRTGIAAERLPGMIALLGENLSANGYFLELRGDNAPPVRIESLIARLSILDTLLKDASVFTADRLAFLQAQAALFGIADFTRPVLQGVRNLESFRRLAARWVDDEENTPDLEGVLTAFTQANRFANADQEELADMLGCNTALLYSLQQNLLLSTTAFEVLEELQAGVTEALRLGTSGATLKLVQSTVYADLASASSAIQSAFRAKYDNEAEWQKNLEPFRDLVLSRQRDGLTEYLIYSGAPEIDEVQDLYHYYLIDVELEGCARTSRVAAAIASVQLYVQRVMLNREETPPGHPDPVHVLPGSIPEDQWSWRKNYRVWEANRKIFLYPENYLEPELRDDKSPLFKTLEEELLANEITEEAILDAYGRYLRGFDELAHLRIAGSFHEKNETAKEDVLHLFGMTSDDPPMYYYRRVENVEYGVSQPGRTTHWGPWEPMNIQTPVRKVAPLVHNGQLYVFWIRYTSKSLNEVKDGNSTFVGYQHRMYVEFSKRRLDGSWTPPQTVRLNEEPFDRHGEGIILDPIVPKGPVVISIPIFGITIYSDYRPLYDEGLHERPKEEYTLTGFGWDQVYPTSASELVLRGANFQMYSPLDLYRLEIGERYEIPNSDEARVPWINPAIWAILWLLSGGKMDLPLPPRVIWSRVRNDQRHLHSIGEPIPCFDAYSFSSLLLDEARILRYEKPLSATGPAVWTDPQWDDQVTNYLKGLLKENRVISVPEDATLDVVNASYGDVIIQTSDDIFYLQEGARSDGKYLLRRLSTTVSEKIASVLFNHGIEELLATETQLRLQEKPNGLNLAPNLVYDDTQVGKLDYRGPMGGYLREIFFHIPFLIANHLNSQGKYAEAQRWYHYIFDPTSSETIAVPAGLPDEERRRRELDRNWRYREFRELTASTLRDQLTNAAAIEAYRRDPFNPHAIARLRISANQKAIVMKYVDNLLDWGDDLFIQAFAALNTEYLREATLLYVTAQEVLGLRPARLGDCGEGKLKPKNFPNIKGSLSSGSEFLMEIESLIWVNHYAGARAVVDGTGLFGVRAEQAWRSTLQAYSRLQPRNLQPAAAGIGAAVSPGIRLSDLSTPQAIDNLRARVPPETAQMAARMTFADVAVTRARADISAVTTAGIYGDYFHRGVDVSPDFGISFYREISPVFCVPRNELLLRYWDRVEDRLCKLRNCMDIEGVVRKLPLFAPPIDPGLLVAGRAAGLSLEDILRNAASSLPPYRYRYLVEKARSFVGVVQTLGGQLLAALEKRDAEELARLRNTHQKNILKLTTEVRKQEVEIAQQRIEAANRRQTAARYRYDYYDGLISSGPSALEWLQIGSHVTASTLRTAAGVLDTLAGIAHLVPELGSPFSLKYGGKQLGDSGKTWAEVMKDAAGVFGEVATTSGLIAGFERRSQGWEHQKKLAENELNAIGVDIAIAEIQKKNAEKNQEIHLKTIEQHDEVIELFSDKFSNLGLYTYLSRTLQGLFREAYNHALALAQLAEQAYHFERPADRTIYMGGEWEAARAGLLSGERLLMSLNRMERRFIETNDRSFEVNQSFSLAQMDPNALISLKEMGSCTFTIPELFFDLFYPGQYRRRIRAVRLTVPCITGPYTNVGAKLTLLHSFIRNEALIGPANLIEIPPGRTQTVATSTAQGDAGVFELSFRDERYMPFEGAGAVSEWQLDLPSQFHPFDYSTITDIIINLSYTAEEDGALRQTMESNVAGLQGSLLNYLSNNSLVRVISLRQEFSNAYNRIIQAAAGTPETFDLTDRHFPLFLQGRALQATGVDVVLVVPKGQTVSNVSLSVNGTQVDTFARGAGYGGLPSKGAAGGFAAGLKGQHTLIVNNAGDLASGGGAGAPIFDADKLRDILLVMQYSL